jgi:hypothetical protein
MAKNPTNSMNSNQERRLSVTCRYIDKLLGDMETALNISASKLAFPHYALDVSSAQKEVVEDYISRIRAQLVRVLDSHGVARPASDIPVSRSLRANLAFINIAMEELKPEYMKGYGEISPAAATELRQISTELQALATQLDRYLASELRENPSERRENLEKA